MRRQIHFYLEFFSWSTPYSQNTLLHNDSEIWNVIKYLHYFCPNSTINRKILNRREFNFNKKKITCIIMRQNKYCHYDKVSIVQNTFSFVSAPKVVILEILYYHASINSITYWSTKCSGNIDYFVHVIFSSSIRYLAVDVNTLLKQSNDISTVDSIAYNLIFMKNEFIILLLVNTES